MERLKVKVSSESESKEAQELFFELGWQWKDSGKVILEYDPNMPFFYLDGEILHKGSSIKNYQVCDRKEITLQELRDMVVLKRNDSKDTNYKNSYGDRYYVSSDLNIYIWQHEKWICHCVHGDIDRLSEMNRIKNTGGDISDLLKPIKDEVMKESLNDKIATAEVARQQSKKLMQHLQNVSRSMAILKMWLL